MKANLLRMLQSGVAMLLVFCMVAGFVPTMAFAAESEKTINYVSIGDSMANGYGFAGYYQTSNDRNVYDFKTGKGMYGVGAYPNQFEDYLTGLGYEVNHTKLATSAMLAEDLLYLLGGREEFDDGWGTGWSLPLRRRSGSRQRSGSPQPRSPRRSRWERGHEPWCKWGG